MAFPDGPSSLGMLPPAAPAAAGSRPQPIPGASASPSPHSYDPAAGATTSDGLASQPIPPRTAPSQQQKQQKQQKQQQHQSCYTSIDTISPRQLLTEIPDAILEECAESVSDSPIEPVTPTTPDGGRHSQDFTKLQNSVDEQQLYFSQYNYSRSNIRSSSPPKAPLLASESTKETVGNPASGPTEQSSQPAPSEQDPYGSLSRRSTRGSTSSSFKRTMSSLFRRGSQTSLPVPQMDGTPSPPSLAQAPTDGLTLRPHSAIHDTPKKSNGTVVNGGPPPSKHHRRFSMTRSAVTTRSNTPPSPGSPAERTMSNTPTSAPNGGLPGANDFDAKKKNRSSTGLSLRGRTINFLTPTTRSGQLRSRRASSFDTERPDSKGRYSKSSHGQEHTFPPERQPWALPPDAGTGAKARRMSLSLPDDFTVDVAELSQEFEYLHKLLGRHGKHLGKGAASKVTLMARKGCPEELYAVKEFRGKSNRESREDYDKKIKSEFSIAKSLHHPNIVETIRLCTDHSRWNHVMEYCSEGDLFSLVSKGYLKDENRKKDRLCLFKQLVQGVNYLHQNGIAHRDIKLENLLITKDSKLKITDFGVSEVFSGTHPGLRESGGQCGRNMGEVRLCPPGICGSEPYIAPEVLAKSSDYDPRPLDVWSTAIVMVYLTFGGAIWTRAAPGNEHYDTLVRGWDRWNAKHPDPDACITEMDYPHHKAFDLMVSPPALRRVLLQMLNPDPARRISIADVVNNRWMKNVECCQMESYDDPGQVIDATKRDATWNGHKKIFCHNHLPPKSQGHSLGKMPGQPGY